MQEGSILLTRPISELVIGPLETKYIGRVWRYLERLGCRVQYLQARNAYHICFPEGTVEQVRAGQSTQWTHRTSLLFPAGEQLTKYVVVSLSCLDRSSTLLAFPNEILLGPEPDPG